MSLNMSSVISASMLPGWSHCEEEFWWACQDDDLTTVTNLLESHPTMALTTCNKDGISPLYACAFYNSNLVLGLLLTTHWEYLDPNQQTDIGLTPLHAACMSGNLEGCKLLVKRGADINIKDKNGTMPISFAEYGCHKDIVDFFYHSGLIVEEEEEKVIEYWHCHICTKANILSSNVCECCGRVNEAVLKAKVMEEEKSARTEQMSRIKAMSKADDEKRERGGGAVSPLGRGGANSPTRSVGAGGRMSPGRMSPGRMSPGRGMGVGMGVGGDDYSVVSDVTEATGFTRIKG
ncbi:hypothetical protein TL16_g01378 [Triparma laevis f. inornata]|uniref:RanBP2-type domain-containing protein n=2 Tax=Triparma laevis TaxID=1534972 RepID=A0A9W6ZIV7_9STRA|nr:hypothetical protein TL16_g01378 [Triparma laevis f. inornata]GMH53541.1 hypothetical protein TrLO_g202 [Triparma laevis f. longispina]